MAKILLSVTLDIELDIPDKKVGAFLRDDLPEYLSNNLASLEFSDVPEWDEDGEVQGDCCSNMGEYDIGTNVTVTHISKDNGDVYKFTKGKLVKQK